MGRFVIGLLIGAGIGFAGVLLLGPRLRGEGAEETAPGAGDEGGEGMVGDVRRRARGLRGRIDEALAEAKEAQREAEQELLAQYERELPPEEPPADKKK